MIAEVELKQKQYEQIQQQQKAKTATTWSETYNQYISKVFFFIAISSWIRMNYVEDHEQTIQENNNKI